MSEAMARLKAWAADTLPDCTFWTVRRVSEDLLRASVVRNGSRADAVGEMFTQALASAAGKLRRGEGQVLPTECRRAAQ